MNKIKFSGTYRKLWGQTQAELLAVRRVKIGKDTPPALLSYDTVRTDGSKYPLRSGEYLLLVFLGEFKIPFTTIRAAWPPKKEAYYKGKIGETFRIVIQKGA